MRRFAAASSSSSAARSSRPAATRAIAVAYRQLAEFFPQRIEAVDGSRPPAEIAKEIFGRVRESL